MSTTTDNVAATLQTLPGDDVRQIMWRFSDRFDIQMLVQSTRSVARGPVARVVAEGGRNTHEWTDLKASLWKHYDESGITGAFLDPEHGGFMPGPKNLVLSLVAFELAWVDAGAATSSLAGNLAYAPINERGTPEQYVEYMTRMDPANEGGPLRGAFGLTEPLPYVGVETSILGGKMRVAEWEDGQEPMLQVDKRGRFITNMDTAGYVTAAVESDDDRIKGTCMIILEETDPGLYDRGAPTMKLVHQLSSTRDPVLSLKVPAHRIIGGYTVKDGVIVPNFTHSQVIEAVFRRTRVTVGLMTAAKLLSAVEPVIRYQRGRFRGGDKAQPGTARYEEGIQQKEDALHRLADIWATGEAAASLGFATARCFDVLDPMEKEKDALMEAQGVTSSRAEFKVFRKLQPAALEYLELSAKAEVERDEGRYQELKGDTLVQYAILDAEANVLCPACKLWNTGHGATVMREALSLMGGYGITEDCPGFLIQKWTDAQLEATYEGPEAVQRRQMSITMTTPLFLAQLRMWRNELRQIAATHPATGACTIATAIDTWMWTLEHLQGARDAHGKKLYHSPRQGVTFPLADALCWLLASRQQILDVLELEEKGPENATVAQGLAGYLQFFTDLCRIQATNAAGQVGRICAELVHGYRLHPEWDEGTPCDERCKAGPCVSQEGIEEFIKLRAKLDGCLTGGRLAKDRAAKSLLEVMIPEALDYPL
jgi:alkylation response protein AidB-like acyl-CoA dehydrogenase